MDKREHVSKLLLVYSVNLRQTNNGTWCWIEDLSNELIDILYDYISTNLK